MTPVAACLRVQDLGRDFGTRRAVRALTLEVRPGEIYGLVGPDGAGKTTTLRMIAGLLEPSSGEVRIGGYDPFGADERFRDLLGYMPQQYSLYGDLTVSENLAFFREVFCLSRPLYEERRGRLLALTRLAEFRTRRAAALSGGMYKKLALACTLLHQPDVLLLDEPTTGVDPVSRREFWDLLHELLEDGIAIVLATPYMDEASRSHRTGLLFRGRLLEQGRPSDLLFAFPHPVFELHGDRDRIEAELGRSPDVIAFTPAGAELRMVVRRDREEAVLFRLASFGVQARPAAPTFEDLFLTRVWELTPVTS